MVHITFKALVKLLILLQTHPRALSKGFPRPSLLEQPLYYSTCPSHSLIHQIFKRHVGPETRFRMVRKPKLLPTGASHRGPQKLTCYLLTRGDLLEDRGLHQCDLDSA